MGNNSGKITIPVSEESCMHPGCKATVLPNTCVCPLHVCNVKICEELKTTNGKYCMFHTCQKKGCDNRTVLGQGFHCREHLNSR